jgi:hypothetical protein
MNTSARVSSNGDGGVVRFPLSSSNALIIQRGDITKWSIDGSTDAIVCKIYSTASYFSYNLYSIKCVYDMNTNTCR